MELQLEMELDQTYPSLLDRAIVSANCQSFPSGMIPPVWLSRCGVQSTANLIVGGCLASLDLEMRIMPSSLNSWNAFFRVSLFTASKYESSPWW
jgi:hypothetical protein